jgi:hypothetical protein
MTLATHESRDALQRDKLRCNIGLKKYQLRIKNYELRLISGIYNLEMRYLIILITYNNVWY